MPGYRVAARAKKDLSEIHAYIQADSMEGADRMLDQIHETFELLGTSPELGTLRPNYRPANLRTFSVRRYVVAYRYTKNVVEILRVLHGARDIDELMS